MDSTKTILSVERHRKTGGFQIGSIFLGIAAFYPRCVVLEKRGFWQSRWEQGLDGLCLRLGELLPAKPVASMLHGDLWGGNYLVGSEGIPVLIDPAVYYGHHEADLALTELFGGFEPSFYAAYHEVLPIFDAYSERKTIYNLYHLINHLNLFGGSYAGSVEAILRKYV